MGENFEVIFSKINISLGLTLSMNKNKFTILTFISWKSENSNRVTMVDCMVEEVAWEIRKHPKLWDTCLRHTDVAIMDYKKLDYKK